MEGMNQTSASNSSRPDSGRSGPGRSWAFIAIAAGFLVSVALIIAVGVVAIDLTS